MLDCGKVTDTIYKRSVRKVIERKVSGAVSQGDAIRDIILRVSRAIRSQQRQQYCPEIISHQQVQFIWR